MQMPSMVKDGDTVMMECMLDTMGATIEWMMWTKDGQEIWRMAPGSPGTKKDVEGVNLDVS